MSSNEFAAMNLKKVALSAHFLGAIGFMGCAPALSPSAGEAPLRGAGEPLTVAAVAPTLPPVPPVNGAPLAIRVVYPASNQVIASRDSNFLLGTIGSGDASLSINGHAVNVAPNGAFLAWIPNPPTSSPTYNLVAVRGNESAQHVLNIRYPTQRPPLPPMGRLRVDSATVSPALSAKLILRSDESVRVSVRAPSNSIAWIESNRGSDRQPLVIANELQRSSFNAARGMSNPVAIDTISLTDSNVATVFVTDATAAKLSTGVRLVVARGADTVRFRLAQPALSDREAIRVGVLRSANAVVSDTDRVVIARPTPDGTYKWLLLSGTVVQVTGAQGAFTRVRLDSKLEVWVANQDLVALPPGTPLPRRITGGFRVVPAAEWVDVNISTGDRPAYFVEPSGKTLKLTLYQTQANPEISPIIGNDTLVRRIAWTQESSDRLEINFELSQQVYGWLVMWDDARRTFVLRIRRVPKVNSQRALEGLTIVVDAGHPPAGTTGPTGLYEGDAVLPVAEKMAAALRARGVNVVMTRSTREPLGLIERTVISRRANAHAFVSIHLNALPDGVNPFQNNGTSTLFFHQPSEPLARHVQSAMMKRFPLRDLGVHYQNLAIARPSWYPAVLAEGLFMMLPEQEAAMRDEAFQQRYADALIEGLEKYFRELAGK